MQGKQWNQLPMWHWWFCDVSGPIDRRHCYMLKGIYTITVDISYWCPVIIDERHTDHFLVLALRYLKQVAVSRAYYNRCRFLSCLESTKLDRLCSNIQQHQLRDILPLIYFPKKYARFLFQTDEQIIQYIMYIIQYLLCCDYIRKNN